MTSQVSLFSQISLPGSPILTRNFLVKANLFSSCLTYRTLPETRFEHAVDKQKPHNTTLSQDLTIKPPSSKLSQFPALSRACFDRLRHEHHHLFERTCQAYELQLCPDCTHQAPEMHLLNKLEPEPSQLTRHIMPQDHAKPRTPVDFRGHVMLCPDRE